MKERSSIRLIGSFSLLVGGAAIGACLISAFGSGNKGIFYQAETATYQFVLSQDNGAILDVDYSNDALVATSARSTASDLSTYEVDVNYKAAKAGSNVYCLLSATGGSISLATPLYNMTSIVVNSSATAGQATLSWGLTADCSDDSVTTINGAHQVGGANYFTLSSVDTEISVVSISVTYGCYQVNNDGEATSYPDGGIASSGDGNNEPFGLKPLAAGGETNE